MDYMLSNLHNRFPDDDTLILKAAAAFSASCYKEDENYGRIEIKVSKFRDSLQFKPNLKHNY